MSEAYNRFMIPEALERLLGRGTEGPKIRTRGAAEEALRESQAELLHRSRRELLINGGKAALTITGVALAWRVLASLKEPDSLDYFVGQALSMERNFREGDLSNETIRNQYAWIMAGIFKEYSSSRFSRGKLYNSLVFVDDSDRFTELFVQSHSLPPDGSQDLAPSSFLNSVYGFVSNGKAYIDLEDPFFRPSIYIPIKPAYPRGWNSLKSLRVGLSHEFFHLVVEPQRSDPILTVIDPQNQSPNKYVEGFRIKDWHSPSAGRFAAFDEATVERLSTQMTQDLFRDFYSNYVDSRGQDITNMTQRLTDVLMAARVGKLELRQLHRESRLSEFLMLLVEREGAISLKSPDKVRLLRGIRIMNAIIENDQFFLQSYIHNASRKQLQ